MPGAHQSRRSFLLSSFAVSTVALAGCSSSKGSGGQAPLNKTDTAEAEANRSSPSPTQQPDSPFDPRSLPQSAPSEFLLDEVYGTISFSQAHPYFLVELPPADVPLTGDRCLVLEYDVTADLGFSTDSQLDVRLITDYERDEYIEEAKNERRCVGIPGHTLYCLDNDELEQFESDFDSDAFAAHVKERQYKRVLLPPERYWLVFDATDIWGGKDAQPPEIQKTTLKIAVRIMRDPLGAGERAAITTINNIAADLEGDQCETLAEINALTSEICSLEGAEGLSRESVETFERDITKLRHYSAFLNDLLHLLNAQYDLDLPTDLASRLETFLEWESSLLPLVGALIKLCSDACDLGATTCESTVGIAERRIKDFLVSLFSLVAEVVLLSMGLSSRVARGAVTLADEFILWYLKELVGFRVYAVILKQASLVVDDSVGAALRYIWEWTRRVWKGDDEGRIDALDLETLANINEDNIDDWRQWDQLLSDRACGAVIASGPLSNT